MGLIDLGDLGSLFKDVREAITGEAIKDPVKKAELEAKLQTIESSLQQGQLEVNKTEAKSNNLFIAGWRPFIGWVGGIALMYSFILSPLIQWGCQIYGLHILPPKIQTDMLFNLVLALLGLGGMRTFEKTKKVQDLH